MSIELNKMYVCVTSGYISNERGTYFDMKISDNSSMFFDILLDVNILQCEGETAEARFLLQDASRDILKYANTYMIGDSFVKVDLMYSVNETGRHNSSDNVGKDDRVLFSGILSSINQNEDQFTLLCSSSIAYLKRNYCNGVFNFPEGAYVPSMADFFQLNLKCYGEVNAPKKESLPLMSGVSSTVVDMLTKKDNVVKNNDGIITFYHKDQVSKETLEWLKDIKNKNIFIANGETKWDLFKRMASMLKLPVFVDVASFNTVFLGVVPETAVLVEEDIVEITNCSLGFENDIDDFDYTLKEYRGNSKSSVIYRTDKYFVSAGCCVRSYMYKDPFTSREKYNAFIENPGSDNRFSPGGPKPSILQRSGIDDLIKENSYGSWDFYWLMDTLRPDKNQSTPDQREFDPKFKEIPLDKDDNLKSHMDSIYNDLPRKEARVAYKVVSYIEDNSLVSEIYTKSIIDTKFYYGLNENSNLSGSIYNTRVDIRSDKHVYLDFDYGAVGQLNGKYIKKVPYFPASSQFFQLPSFGEQAYIQHMGDVEGTAICAGGSKTAFANVDKIGFVCTENQNFFSEQKTEDKNRHSGLVVGPHGTMLSSFEGKKDDKRVPYVLVGRSNIDDVENDNSIRIFANENLEFVSDKDLNLNAPIIEIDSEDINVENAEIKGDSIIFGLENFLKNDSQDKVWETKKNIVDNSIPQSSAPARPGGSSDSPNVPTPGGPEGYSQASTDKPTSSQPTQSSQVTQPEATNPPAPATTPIVRRVSDNATATPIQIDDLPEIAVSTDGFEAANEVYDSHNVTRQSISPPHPSRAEHRKEKRDRRKLEKRANKNRHIIWENDGKPSKYSDYHGIPKSDNDN